LKRNILILIVVVVLAAVAALAFSVFRTPEEASAPITAATLTIETSQPVAAQPTVAPTVAPVAAEATAAPAEAPTAAPEPTAAPDPAPATELAIFEIVPAESQARFIIDEVLRGSPERVVGVTDQVAGQVAIDPANPAATQLGEVRVNARTLATDNSFRNRAIKNFILQTDAFEFVTFQPTELVGLPETVTVGQPFTFQVVGDLTIRDVTRPTTFDVTVTPVSETRIEGLASVTSPIAISA
jgi:polyisoprenoid-binding protein YceI